MTAILNFLPIACFVCMKTSDEALNNATSQSILAMLAITSVPMLGVVCLVTKVAVTQRRFRRNNPELLPSNSDDSSSDQGQS